MQEIDQVKVEPEKSKVAYWRSVIEDWQKSSESQSTYCQRLGINIHSFTYWRGKFSEKSKYAKNTFIKLLPTPSGSEDEKPIVIQLLSGIKITIPTSTSKDKLINIFEILGVINA